MTTIYKNGPVSIVRVDEPGFSEFYVYNGGRLVRVCPSIGMAREVAAGAV